MKKTKVKKSFVNILFFFTIHLCAAEKIWFLEGANLSDIKTALRNAPQDVDIYNTQGLTGLMYAAKQSRPDLAKAFIDAGAKLNLKSKDAWGQTALHIAAAQAEGAEGAEVFRALVNAGAIVWMKDNYSNQPIHNLRLTDDLDRRSELITLLVKKGGDINAQDKDGNTLLHLTVQDQPWIEKMRADLWPLVDLSIKDKKGFTASQRAYELGQWSNSKLISQPIKKVEPNKRYPNGLTGLMLATIYGNQQRVERMLKPDTKVNLQSNDEFKNTALHLSVFQRHPAIAKLLLDDRTKDSILNAQGQAPIHLIVRSTNDEKRNELAKVFFEDPQVDVNIQNTEGNTLIHLLVMDNDEDTLSYLIKNFPEKVNVSIKNKKFQTPLDLAKKNKNILEMFEQLAQIKQFVGD